MNTNDFDSDWEYYDHLALPSELLAKELLEDGEVPDTVLREFIESHIDFIEECVYDTPEYREYVEIYCKGILGGCDENT